MRTVEGVPGTLIGRVEEPVHDDEKTRRMLEMPWAKTVDQLKVYTMGKANVIVCQGEPAGVKGERIWHATIGRHDRYPTWDEIKVARYRLLPHDLCFAMFLPPPDLWVDVPGVHVFHLHEVDDSRKQWTTL